jgi:hypothetical protein
MRYKHLLRCSASYHGRTCQQLKHQHFQTVNTDRALQGQTLGRHFVGCMYNWDGVHSRISYKANLKWVECMNTVQVEYKAEMHTNRAADAEGALNSAYAKAVHHILSEPEGNDLRYWQREALVKEHAKVDLHIRPRRQVD